jgi:hypothetical protein
MEIGFWGHILGVTLHGVLDHNGFHQLNAISLYEGRRLGHPWVTYPVTWRRDDYLTRSERPSLQVYLEQTMARPTGFEPAAARVQEKSESDSCQGRGPE